MARMRPLEGSMTTAVPFMSPSASTAAWRTTGSSPVVMSAENSSGCGKGTGGKALVIMMAAMRLARRMVAEPLATAGSRAPGGCAGAHRGGPCCVSGAEVSGERCAEEALRRDEWRDAGNDGPEPGVESECDARGGVSRVKRGCMGRAGTQHRNARKQNQEPSHPASIPSTSD